MKFVNMIVCEFFYVQKYVYLVSLANICLDLKIRLSSNFYCANILGDRIKGGVINEENFVCFINFTCFTTCRL